MSHFTYKYMVKKLNSEEFEQGVFISQTAFDETIADHELRAIYGDRLVKVKFITKKDQPEVIKSAPKTKDYYIDNMKSILKKANTE